MNAHVHGPDWICIDGWAVNFWGGIIDCPASEAQRELDELHNRIHGGGAA